MSRRIGIFGPGTIQSGTGKAHPFEEVLGSLSRRLSDRTLVSASAAPAPPNTPSQTIPGAKMTLKLRLVKQAG